MATETQESTLLLDWNLINDLGALPENEDIIVDYLLDRLQRDEIYTWVGSLLLTINPRTRVSTSDINVEYMFPELRRIAINSPELEKYIDISDVTREEAAPHIFAVAAKAHRRVIEEIGRNCQVIVINGEAGTGKTFNACKCLEFLSAVNKNPALLCQGDYVHNNIMLKITDACRLISVFTTACTERNETSSRHGQLVRLHYKNNSISGGTIESFLLERSRVTECSNNFQIFYQMMLGLPEEELHALGLFSNKNYDILNVIDCNKRKYYQDGFQNILREFDLLGFESEQKGDIFQTLALMIHMGNIQFVNVENGETCAIDLTNPKCKEALRNTCLLSSLNGEDIEQLLTTILVTPQCNRRKYTTYYRNLRTVDMCRNRLHSIIRHIYDRLFHWILDRVNSALSVKHECSKWLAILDIFGFECFTENALEQLCVNYANEKMQRYFMETYLENSRKDLHEEGFIENEKPLDIINLYKNRLHVIEEALFSTLNDACQSQIPIDTRAVIQLACGNRHNIQTRFLSEKEGKFIIKHYSGPVAYSIKDLLFKNGDKVPTEISVTFDASNNKFLRSLLNINEKNDLHTVDTSTRKRTMLAKLKHSMDTLIQELSKCDLHYVRCVKPNRLTEYEWDRIDFKKQLACTGIFDALPLAKCKYPIRLSYEDFCQRFSKRFSEICDRTQCEIILESIVPRRKLHALVHYGKRLIFLKESTFHKLEISRRKYRVKCANKIQTTWRKYKKNTSSSPKNLTTSRLKNKLFNENEAIKITNENESKLSCNYDENDDVFSSSTISVTSNISAKYESYIITTKDTKEIYSTNNNISKKNSSALRTWMHDSDNCEKTCITESDGRNMILQSSMQGDLHAIPLGSHTLFYRNRILSRRRLAIVPIRVHTRLTCLTNSHVLPRSVMPRGLEDCL